VRAPAAGAASCWAFHGPIGGEVAKPVRGLGVVVDVAVGDAHGCAVDEAGDVRCWGEDADGEVGVAVDRCPVVDGCATQGGCKHRCDDAVLVEGLPKATKVAAGRRHTCALTREGDVYCWGGDAQELGADASRPGPHRVAF
jgi:alpha-tubulin suppressor-like RCC1 family protein